MLTLIGISSIIYQRLYPITPWFRFLGLSLLLLLSHLLTACEAPIANPNLEPAFAKAKQCILPVEEMRRSHSQLLNQHRDKVVLQGIRSSNTSINNCIQCHIAPTRADGSAIHYPDKEHFCASCHLYVGVKIDCFQCHADRPTLSQNQSYQHLLTSKEKPIALHHQYHKAKQQKLVISNSQLSTQELLFLHQYTTTAAPVLP